MSKAAPARQAASGPRTGDTPGLAARRAATALLGDVLDRRVPLDARLEAKDAPYAGLPRADKGLARAIVSTTLRCHGQIRDAFGQLIERAPPPKAGPLMRILEIAAAQILFMEVADHAAVSLAMTQIEGDRNARHFKPLANGVLRNLARRREAILASQNAASLNTPDWLRESWVAAYGEETADAIGAAHLSEAPLDLSVKDSPAQWAERLGGVALPTGSVRLPAGARVEELAGFADGAWWVQDAAAALPALLLGAVAGKSVLDFCAAPGGKTAQLAAAGADVTAVDISASRIRRLSDNLRRLNLAAECVAADALTYESGTLFDAVLVDAPCSSTGTIRRHPDIAWLKKPGDVAKLASLQHRMLERAVKLTKPGGTIVFATCSLQPDEGPAMIAQAMPALPVEPLPVVVGEVPGLRPEWIADGWLRTLPFHFAADDTSGLDGFFAARLRRL